MDCSAGRCSSYCPLQYSTITSLCNSTEPVHLQIKVAAWLQIFTKNALKMPSVCLAGLGHLKPCSSHTYIPVIEGLFGCVNGNELCVAKLCDKEMRWQECISNQELEPRGNHRRHTRTINTSPPTQANDAARDHERQLRNQADAHESTQETTHTSHRMLCHQGTGHRYGSTAPTAGAKGTGAAPTQLRLRRRGLSLIHI